MTSGEIGKRTPGTPATRTGENVGAANTLPEP
jgi:hypothetical protein